MTKSILNCFSGPMADVSNFQQLRESFRPDHSKVRPSKKLQIFQHWRYASVPEPLSFLRGLIERVIEALLLLAFRCYLTRNVLKWLAHFAVFVHRPNWVAETMVQELPRGLSMQKECLSVAQKYWLAKLRRSATGSRTLLAMRAEGPQAGWAGTEG